MSEEASKSIVVDFNGVLVGFLLSYQIIAYRIFWDFVASRKIFFKKANLFRSLCERLILILLLTGLRRGKRTFNCR